MIKNHPAFLNAEFLTACLQNEVEENLKVVRFEVNPALAQDLNFASIVLRVKTFYKTVGEEDVNVVSLIIKTPPEHECLNMSEIFGRKENTFYSNILPKILKWCDVNIFTKSFLSPIPTVVVLEDLSSSGYKAVDRIDLLDFEHCKLYFQAGAKMHAASTIVVEKDPTAIGIFGNGGNWLLDEDPDMKRKFRNMSTIGVKCLADLVRNMDDYKDIVEVLDEVAEDSWDFVIAAEKSNGCFNCLIQFDCHKTNMMFKYSNNGGKVESVKLIDFQVYSYLPAVIDIINFVWRSANDEVRENRLEELYQIYCDNLNQHLADLGSSQSLSFQNFKQQLDVFSPLVIHMVSFFVPYGQAKNQVDLNTLFGYSVNDPQKCYDSVKEMIRQSPHIYPGILKHLKNQGVLEAVRRLYLQRPNQ